MKNFIKYSCFYFAVIIFQFGHTQVAFIKDSITISRKKLIERPLFKDFSGNLSLEVKEVYEPWETCEPFSDDFGNFTYCGDVIGGIKNLLQTDSWATPHLHFENQPVEKRKVYFHGIGTNVKASKSMDTTKYYSNSYYIDCRAIILKIMAEHFEFEVQETEDYLDLLELYIVDTSKLYSLRSPTKDCIEEKGGHGYADSIPNIYISKCLPLWFIADQTERSLNTFTTDMTGDLHHYYSFRMPRKYIEPNIILEDLNNYLEENIGVKFVRKKKTIKSKIYNIKFKNGKE
jgi:hypothetical protein